MTHGQCNNKPTVTFPAAEHCPLAGTHFQSNGLRNGDEHPSYTLLSEYGIFDFETHLTSYSDFVPGGISLELVTGP